MRLLKWFIFLIVILFMCNCVYAQSSFYRKTFIGETFRLKQFVGTLPASPVGYADIYYDQYGNIMAVYEDGRIDTLSGGGGGGAIGNVVRSINGLKDTIYVVGYGGTVVTTSGDTLKITSIDTAGSGGGVTGIQNTDSKLLITNPTGPTVTLNIGTIDGTDIAANSIDSGHIKPQSIPSSKVTPNFKAPYATLADGATTSNYATTAGGAPPTGTILSGDAAGSSYPNFIIKGQAITGSKIALLTLTTGLFASNAKSPLAGYSDSTMRVIANGIDSNAIRSLNITTRMFNVWAKINYARRSDTATVALNVPASAESIMYAQRSDTSNIGLDIPEEKKINSIPATSEVAAWNASQELVGSGINPESLAIASLWKRWQARDSTYDMLPEIFASESTFTNATITRDKRGRVTYASSGTGGGGGGFYRQDTGSFVGTAQYDTIFNINFTPTDRFVVNSYYTNPSTFDVEDHLFYSPQSEKCVVARAASGSANLKYSWVQYYEGESPSVGWNPEQYNTSSFELIVWIDAEKERIEKAYTNDTKPDIIHGFTSKVPFLYNGDTLHDDNRATFKTGGNGGDAYWYFTGYDSAFAWSANTDLLNLVNTPAKADSASDSLYMVMVFTSDSAKYSGGTSCQQALVSWTGTVPSHQFQLETYYSSSALSWQFRDRITGYDFSAGADITENDPWNIDSLRNPCDSLVILDTVVVGHNIDSSAVIEFIWSSTAKTVKIYLDTLGTKVGQTMLVDSVNTKFFSIGGTITTLNQTNATKPSRLRMYKLYVWRGIPDYATRRLIISNIDMETPTAVWHDGW